MAYVELAIPPGVVRNGTEYGSKGRWYDANLWRWHAGAARPVGGWTALGSGVVGAARALMPWRDNNNTAWAGIGTDSHLYVCDRSGNVSDITPPGFTVGRRDAVLGGGFGTGDFGTGTFGTPILSASESLDATVWSLDTFGPYLIGLSPDDGGVYEWTLSVATPAQKIVNAPSGSALFSTNEHMIMVLAASGDPRQIAWSDQANNTLWTSSNTNTAGSIELQTSGRLMCGRRTQSANLIWTDIDCWVATNLQSQLIYGFTKVGDGCGIISRGAAVVLNNQAVWMGPNDFYTFNGYVVEPLDCDVADFVFSNMNAMQASKVCSFYNSLYGEAWWFYPSVAGTENDSYVCWNPRDNVWSIGKLVRLSACDRAALPNPLMVDAGGNIFTHETGFNWGGAMPYARSGPTEVGIGDKVLCARQTIPDEATLGGVTLNFYGRAYPEDALQTFGPYTLAPRTDTRFTAREVEMLLTASANADFRVGTFRLEGTPGGQR